MNKKFSIAASMLLAIGLVACKPTTDAPSNGTVQLKDGTYEGVGQGNNGPITLSVNVKDGKIDKVDVVKQAETKGLGDLAIDKVSKQIVENQSVNVDTVSGATNSSNGTITAVKDALTKAGATEAYFTEMAKVSMSEVKMDDTYTYDVVIVGAGGAGLSAAIEASKAGASVAVLEKTPSAGGNTLVSGGGINAPGTRQQIALDIHDDVDTFYQDTLKGGDQKGDPQLVEYMANHALEAADWLMDDVHVDFLTDRVQQFGGHSVARALIPVGNKGTELINKMLAVCKANHVDVYYETQAEHLLQKDGVVNGVQAKYHDQSITFNANKGVILASGGFAANIEMRKQYNAHYDERFKTTATLASTGDGIVMAQEVGADTVGMEYIQVYPTCNPITGIISYVANSRFNGAILINQNGDRFVNEMGRRDDISNAILAQSDSISYLVWDDTIEKVANMIEVHAVEFEQLKKDDLIYVADSLEDAAKHYNIPVEELQKSIEQFNAAVDANNDEQFHKTGAMRKIETGPFYIQKVTPSTHHTMGGIKINTNAQVLNQDGQVIPHLYAAGEVTGGIHGTNRLGGNAITDIVVFGRTAGQQVVKE